jgi:hypothetical protein
VARVCPILAPGGQVTIYALRSDNTFEEILVNPAQGTVMPAPLPTPPGEGPGTPIVQFAGGTNSFSLPMCVVLYQDGHAYEWSDSLKSWLVLSRHASLAAAGVNGVSVTVDDPVFHGRSGTVDDRVFHLHSDALLGGVTVSFRPPRKEPGPRFVERLRPSSLEDLFEQGFRDPLGSWLDRFRSRGVAIVQVDAGADAAGNPVITALFSDGHAWAWNSSTIQWQFLAGSVKKVAAGVNGALAWETTGDQLTVVQPGNPFSPASAVIMGLFGLGSTAQGDGMIGFQQTDGTYVEVNGTTGMLNPLPSLAVSGTPVFIVPFGMGNKGASAWVYYSDPVGTDGTLMLRIDNTPAGGVTDLQVLTW